MINKTATQIHIEIEEGSGAKRFALIKRQPYPMRGALGPQASCYQCHYALKVPNPKGDTDHVLRCSNIKMLGHRKSHHKFQAMVNSGKYFCMQWE